VSPAKEKFFSSGLDLSYNQRGLVERQALFLRRVGLSDQKEPPGLQQIISESHSYKRR
jgi:hypothetical protein